MSWSSEQHIFSGLEERFGAELGAVRTQFPSEPVRFTDDPLVVHWEDGIKMLREAGHEVRSSESEPLTSARSG